MTAQIVPCYFSPSGENAWSAAPGALASLNAFAPLQMGAYGSMAHANLFGTGTLTGTDMLSGRLFRQLDGTVRLLVFRATNIDEYVAAGTRTNRGTGYTTTARWEAAAWGNQIIAVSAENATQSSTGAGFTALSGAPKATCVAASQNFVMMGNVASTPFTQADGVYWCAYQNPADWTPALDSQCGYTRLVAASGPIQQIKAFRDGFLIWKHNALFFMSYIGPGFVFRDDFVISNRIGCIAPQSVAVLDGKAYWLDSSGFYEYDGQAIRNIGMPVHLDFLWKAGLIVPRGFKYTNAFTAESVTLCQAAIDEFEGVVWWKVGFGTTIVNTIGVLLYGYNVRTQRWGYLQVITSADQSSATARMVFGGSMEAQTFKADKQGRFLMLWNDAQAATATLRSIQYPARTVTGAPASYGTGVYGSVDGAAHITKHYLRTLDGTDQDTGLAAVTTGYQADNQNVSAGSMTGVYNPEFDDVDVRLDSKFRQTSVTFSVGKLTLLAGVGFDGVPAGKR